MTAPGTLAFGYDGDGGLGDRLVEAVRTTAVTVTPLHLVGDDVAHAEGEGVADAAAWRRAHEAFWRDVTDPVRADAGDPSWQLRPSEPVVVHHFELVPD